MSTPDISAVPSTPNTVLPNTIWSADKPIALATSLYPTVAYKVVSELIKPFPPSKFLDISILFSSYQPSL